MRIRLPECRVTKPNSLKRYIGEASALFLVAVGMNYVWEIAEAPLYVGFESYTSVWLHCFIASLGDGILVWLIFVVGWITFRRFDWYAHPNSRTLAVVFLTGLQIGIGIEWVAINMLGRWAYTVDMPLLPGLDVGLVPVLQMLLLPPVIFRIVAWWAGKECIYAEKHQGARGQ